MINPISFTIDVARAAIALPSVILRLPEVVDNLDRLAWDLVPKLRDATETLARPERRRAAR